jgi:hypothetical protein
VDVADGAAVREGFTPQAWHEIAPDIVVCRSREIRSGRVCARELVLSKTRGLIRDETYAIRLYDAPALADLMTQSGFVSVAVRRGVDFHRKRADYGFMNSRMIASGRKPE